MKLIIKLWTKKKQLKKILDRYPMLEADRNFIISLHNENNNEQVGPVFPVKVEAITDLSKGSEYVDSNFMEFVKDNEYYFKVYYENIVEQKPILNTGFLNYQLIRFFSFSKTSDTADTDNFTYILYDGGGNLNKRTFVLQNHLITIELYDNIELEGLYDIDNINRGYDYLSIDEAKAAQAENPFIKLATVYSVKFKILHVRQNSQFEFTITE